MHHFTYITTHINGKYYVGRHSTTKIEDGYLGSGKWVNSIKDQSTLCRTIIQEKEGIFYMMKAKHFENCKELFIN